MQTTLLWIGTDSPGTKAEFDRILQKVQIVTERSLVAGLQRLAQGEFGMAILTTHSLSGPGESELKQLLSQDPRFPVIVHYPEGTIDDAIQLTRQGAFYVLLGEIDSRRLERAVDMALERCRPKLRADIDALPWRRFVIGQSRAMQHICEVIQLVASKRCTVLISGETGTGKEVIAKSIHAASTRSGRAMVSVNCTALPASLIETELFGHAKGAFTGAHGSRIGRFEQANRSTIFLDEIGDLPLDAQAKLLRVLQEQEFERVGSSETVRVDVRVLAASNVNLEKAVEERRFREDLYYRLNVVPIRIPPLRERREDIPLLLDHFLEKIQATEDAAPKQLSPEAVEFLKNQEWPGNVRQLEHAVHKAFALSGERPILFASDFASHRPAQRTAAPTPERPLFSIPQEGINFDEVVSSFELSLLNQALTASNGNKARAADLLRIKRTTLLAKMKTFEERQTGVIRRGPELVKSHPAALVFEVDGSVRKLIAKTLEEEGYRILEAASGSIALDLFECWKSHIQLIVTPAWNGSSAHDTSSRLRSFAPSLPMIVTSDHRYSELASLEYQGAEVLQFPFASEDLLSLVRELGRGRTGKQTQAVCA